MGDEGAAALLAASEEEALDSPVTDVRAVSCEQGPPARERRCAACCWRAPGAGRGLGADRVCERKPRDSAASARGGRRRRARAGRAGQRGRSGAPCSGRRERARGAERVHTQPVGLAAEAWVRPPGPPREPSLALALRRVRNVIRHPAAAAAAAAASAAPAGASAAPSASSASPHGKRQSWAPRQRRLVTAPLLGPPAHRQNLPPPAPPRSLARGRRGT
jgi:hypothetical protein